MKLSELFASGKFVVTSEIGPPKGVDIHEAMEEAEHLKGKVDGINVTDLQSSVMRIGSMAICHLLIDKGLNPIFQMTCRDRNRIALQSDLLSAWVLGIENVLALTGDHPALGDHPQAKGVFDLESVQLLETIQKLNSGYDLAGKELKGSPAFCSGAVVSPASDPVEPQILKMEKKINAGVQFFQTQAVYEVESFEKFMKKVKHFNVPVMAGIVMLKSAGMAKFMNKNVAGVRVPQNLIEEMDKATDKVAKSIEITVKLIKQLKPLCQGIHIMPLGWDKHVPTVLSESDLA